MLRVPRHSAALSFAAILIFLSGASFRAAQNPSEETARQALGVLERNCAECHAGAGAYSFDVRNPRTIIEAKVVTPGHAADSEMIRRVEAGVMPLRGPKLSEAEIALLRRWVDAGAPIPAQATGSARPFVTESDTVAAILDDLEAAPAANRGYLRYVSFANLWNARDVDEKSLAAYRTAFGTLANHLSWKRDIVQPSALGPNGMLLRIDLRDYGWTAETWGTAVSRYPYAMIARELQPSAARIRSLSGASVPYIRADWFTAKASVAPLYHEILDLPDTLEGLERRLHVINTNTDTPSTRAARFGLRNSGVSRNNRAMERQPTAEGAYWKSFDYSGNRIEQNIFRDPVKLVPDGGEVIFSLPNGLQAYFIVNAEGRRIDEAPVAIVRDRTNPDDPVVRNGRSCMGCHVKGINGFQDEIAATLTSKSGAVFDVRTASALYRGQTELDRFIQQDTRRFSEALARTGAPVPAAAAEEPVNRLARRYEESLSPAHAAAELNVEDAGQLKTAIAASVELQRRGFDQLLAPNGGIPRDAWEQGFDRLVQEMRLGEPVGADSLVRIGAGTTLRMELVDMLSLRKAKRGDEVWFRTVSAVPVPKGSSVRGTIAEIQPGKGIAGVRIVLDTVRMKDGSLFRLPASVVALVDSGNPAGANPAQPSAIQVLGVLSAIGAGRNAATMGAGGWGGAGAAVPGMGTVGGNMSSSMAPAPSQDMIPRGALFEARF